MLFGGPLKSEPLTLSGGNNLQIIRNCLELLMEKQVLLYCKRFIVHTNLNLRKRYLNETIDYAKLFVSTLTKWQKLEFL